jgi:hypothetical protein
MTSVTFHTTAGHCCYKYNQVKLYHMQKRNKTSDTVLIVFIYLIAIAISYIVFLKIKLLIH